MYNAIYQSKNRAPRPNYKTRWSNEEQNHLHSSVSDDFFFRDFPVVVLKTKYRKNDRNASIGYNILRKFHCGYFNYG